MTRSEPAQSLTGTRDLRRLSADAGLFRSFKDRAPSSGFRWHSHQLASSTGARRLRIKRCGAAAQPAAVSPGVAHGCDLSLPAVALGRCIAGGEQGSSCRGVNDQASETRRRKPIRCALRTSDRSELPAPYFCQDQFGAVHSKMSSRSVSLPVATGALASGIS